MSAKGDLSAFGDSQKISKYSVDAVKWACGVGILNGDNYGNLNPGGTTTRAEAATILYRFCTNVLQSSAAR